MEHFRIILETGKKLSESRVLHVKQKNIVDAYEIGKKIKGRITNVIPESFEEYMTGISLKYK